MVLLLTLSLSMLITSALSNLQIKWSRPRVVEEFRSKFLPYSVQNLVYLNVCENKLLVGAREFKQLKDVADIEYTWKFYSKDRELLIESITTFICATKWIAPEGESVFQVECSANITKKVAKGSTTIELKTFWMAAIGDSYMSGEGCPSVSKTDTLTNPIWTDSDCHRSNTSFSYLAYEKIASAYPHVLILFNYMACSGATLGNFNKAYRYGMFGEQVKDLLYLANNCNKTTCESADKIRPDLVMLAIGGNDVGYSRVIPKMLRGESFDEYSNKTYRMEIFQQIKNNFAVVNEDLKSGGISPSSILLVEYLNMFSNLNEHQFHTCAGFPHAKATDLALLQQVNVEFENFLKVEIVKGFGWKSVSTVKKLFDQNGVCSKTPFVASAAEVMSIQGDMYGFLHPNCEGQKLAGNLLFRYLQPTIKAIMNK